MLKQVLSAAVAVIAFGTPAMAADAPILSGKYAANIVQNCVKSFGDLFQFSGTLDFDSSHGKVKVDGYFALNNPLELEHQQQTGSYSNGNNTLTIDTVTYKAAYGKVEKGIATFVSYIAVVPGGESNCAVQGWLSRK